MSTAEAARFYAGLGWHVFPVSQTTKQPLIGQWQMLATSDPARVAAWWQQWPQAMIGAVCGPTSGIAVVDLDVKPDGNGVDNLAALENQHGSIGDVPEVSTPSGGLHLYFRADSLPFNKSESRIAPHIDVRSATPDGEGVGYIILAPSMRADGVRYEWNNTTEDQLVNLPEAPGWLAVLACFSEKERKLVQENEALAQLLEAAERRDWRPIFDVHQENERRLNSIGREQAQAANGKAPTLDHPYIAKAIDAIIGGLLNQKVAQNHALYVAAASVGNFAAGVGLTATSDLRPYEERLFDAAMRLPVLDPSKPWNDREGKKKARQTIKSGLETGLKNPRDLSHLNTPKAPAVERYLSVVAMDTIESRPVTWLWPGRLAAGKLSMVAGDPDLGKSQVSIYLASRVTTGKPFHTVPSVVPNAFDKPEPRDPANVILISGEDDPADTIKPRLVAAGADVKRVRLVTDVVNKAADGNTTHEGFSFQKNIPELRALIESVGNVKLVVIDPLSAYLGSTDSHKNSEVRAILTPLAQLAAETGVAIVVIAHLNKGGGEKAIYRISGSLGFVAAARSVFLVTRDEPKDEEGQEGDPTRRLFVPIKNNLAPPMPGLVYKLEAEIVPDATGVTCIRTSRVEWLNETTGVTANAALNGAGTADDSKLDQAKDFLRVVLGEGAKLSADVEAEAEKAGLAWATVRRASSQLGVRVSRPKGEKNPGWRWELPAKEAARLAQLAAWDAEVAEQAAPSPPA